MDTMMKMMSFDTKCYFSTATSEFDRFLKKIKKEFIEENSLLIGELVVSNSLLTTSYPIEREFSSINSFLIWSSCFAQTYILDNFSVVVISGKNVSTKKISFEIVRFFLQFATILTTFQLERFEKKAKKEKA